MSRWKHAVRITGTGVLAVACSSAYAGAWTFPTGDGQVILTMSYTLGPKGYDANGKTVDRASYDKGTLELLMEYGINDKTTVYTKPQLRHVTIDDGDHATSLGYAEVGVRQQIWSAGDWVVSGQGSFFFPGQTDAGNNSALVGSTEFEADARILVGRGLEVLEGNGFFNAEFAYRGRSGAPPSEYRLDLSVGFEVTPRAMLVGQSFNTVSDGAGDDGFDRYRYHNVWLSTVWSLKPDTWLQAGAIFTVAGENALRERGGLLALWRRF